MSAKHIFVDTNILVYAHDSEAGSRHRTARQLVSDLWDLPYPPAISTQVLQELYVNLVRKGANNPDSKKIISIYMDWEIVGHDSRLVFQAIDLRERYKLSLWDSLIVVAAQTAKASILWSEDLQAGQNFDGVFVVNPLEAE